MAAVEAEVVAVGVMAVTSPGMRFISKARVVTHLNRLRYQ